MYYDSIINEPNIKKEPFNNLNKNQSQRQIISLKKKTNKGKSLTLPQIPIKSNINYNPNIKKKKIRKVSSIDESINSKYKNNSHFCEDLRYEMLLNKLKGVRKSPLPKLEKKKLFDYFPIKFDTKYIDQVENKFINPFISNNKSQLEVVYVLNKKSNIPFKFNF